MNILVTGGAGYIGSHTVVELLENNHEVTIVDNLINSSSIVLERINKITSKTPDLHVFDLRDSQKLEVLFSKKNFDAVIHFAGLKAVGESTKDPLLYYRTNVDSTLSLLETMQKYHVKKLVFSSSATVYGSAPIPYTEGSPSGQDISSPYGQTKYFIEKILENLAQADPSNSFTILRYFNPAGAHPSGLIGEDPKGPPNNLMPYVSQVASGKLQELSVYGGDYDTPDGTAIRDYVHVVDLSKGHLAALQNISAGINIYNLGTGKGTSVLEIIDAFKTSTGKDIPYKITNRRPGDLPEYYADVTKANNRLHWHAEKTILDICKDAWNWQSKNPNGYEH